MNKNINLGLITIGNGNWKKVIKNLWESLDIKETKIMINRAIEEYNYKLNIKSNIGLPYNMTNHDLHLKDGYVLRLIIASPVQSNYCDNNKMVGFPWWDEELEYRIGSKACCEKIIEDNYFDNIILLYGENLDKDELIFKDKIVDLCVKNGKKFWEIGNDCECMEIEMVIRWIESGENYCGYFRNDKLKVGMTRI